MSLHLGFLRLVLGIFDVRLQWFIFEIRLVNVYRGLYEEQLRKGTPLSERYRSIVRGE
jgi:hypothetical protein